MYKRQGYTDEAAFIFAETDGQPHNTITPIARMRDGKYELDLTLRNNITTEEHPLGVYHPHKELHHIKKEKMCIRDRDYIQFLGTCIAHLNPEIVIHRLTGDGPKDLLIAPLWTSNKRTVLNQLHSHLKEQDIWQGKEYYV